MEWQTFPGSRHLAKYCADSSSECSLTFSVPVGFHVGQKLGAAAVSMRASITFAAWKSSEIEFKDTDDNRRLPNRRDST